MRNKQSKKTRTTGLRLQVSVTHVGTHNTVYNTFCMRKTMRIVPDEKRISRGRARLIKRSPLAIILTARIKCTRSEERIVTIEFSTQSISRILSAKRFFTLSRLYKPIVRANYSSQLRDPRAYIRFLHPERTISIQEF